MERSSQSCAKEKNNRIKGEHQDHQNARRGTGGQCLQTPAGEVASAILFIDGRQSDRVVCRNVLQRKQCSSGPFDFCTNSSTGPCRNSLRVGCLGVRRMGSVWVGPSISLRRRLSECPRDTTDLYDGWKWQTSVHDRMLGSCEACDNNRPGRILNVLTNLSFARGMPR